MEEASLLSRFALAVLATWRVTLLLAREDGPCRVVWLRRRAATGFWAGLPGCFNYLRHRIAAPGAYFIGSRWFQRLLLWPALLF